MKLKRVNFDRVQVSLDNEQPLNLIYTADGENDEKKIWIGKNINYRYNADNIDIAVQNSSKGMSNSLMIYTRDTLFLESNSQVKSTIKDLIKDGAEEVAVVKTMTGVYIGENPKGAPEIYSKALLDTSKENPSLLSETEKKSELKAYETPSKTMDIMFGLLQKQYFLNAVKTSFARTFILEELAQRYSDDFNKSGLDEKGIEKEYSKRMSEIRKDLDLKSNSSTIRAGEILLSSFNRTALARVESSEDKEILRLYELVKKYLPDTLDSFTRYGESAFPIDSMKADGHQLDIPKIPIWDYQAGGGNGIFDSATKHNTPISLFGTEIRSEQDLDTKEEYKEDYLVYTDVNFLTIRSEMDELRENKSLEKALANAVNYQNPPYTLNNFVAKESIESLRHGQTVFGLFPRSMDDFLKENVNGHIFIVSRELTGYTDPKTPESFCFVVGERYDAEYIELRNADLEKKGLLAYTAKNSINKMSNITTSLVESDTEDAIHTIDKVISKNGMLGSFNFPIKIKSMFEYYKAEPKRLEILSNYLYPKVDKAKEKIQNLSGISEAIKSKWADIQKKIGGESLLKELKIFPDKRSFSKEEKYEKLSYAEVIRDLSLLAFYRDNNPEILKVIENIALDEGRNLELAMNPTALYDLSNPFIPDVKEKITTENLGLMKIYYFPSSFTLAKEENKKIIKDVISDLRLNGTGVTEHTKELLSVAVENAERMVTKSEDVLRDGRIYKTSSLVLVNEDGDDICKLDVPLDTLYKELEKKGLFNINNYVEKAIISKEKKEKILQSFMEQMENLKTLVRQETGNDINNPTMRSISELLAYGKMKNNGNIDQEDFNTHTTKVYVEFANNTGIIEMLRSRVDLVEDIAKVTDSFVLQNSYFSSVSKEKREELSKYIANLFEKNPIDFYGDKREECVGLVSEKINSIGIELNKEEAQDFTLTIYSELSEEYVKRKAIFDGSVRLAKMLVKDYGMMDLIKKQNPSIGNSDLYDRFIRDMALNTMGLMDHQFDATEAFLEISDNVKLDMMMWEMRSGKTLAFLNSSYLQSLYRGEDATVLLETKNQNDITSQMLSHAPQMFLMSNFIMPKTQLSKTVLSEKGVYTHFPEADYFPNLPDMLKPYYVGRGDMAKEELSRFSYEFEKLMGKVRDDGVSEDLEKLKEVNKGSRFIKLLDFCEN